MEQARPAEGVNVKNLTKMQAAALGNDWPRNALLGRAAGLDPYGPFSMRVKPAEPLAYVAVALHTPSMNSSENGPSQA